MNAGEMEQQETAERSRARRKLALLGARLDAGHYEKALARLA